MERDSRETIGKVVLDYSRYPGEDFYCDGAIEDELLEIVKSTAPEKYPAVIREKKSWEVLYHLSDLRENIVEWLPMDKSMKVLEVGSGCGAITGSLAKKAGSVTCVDLSRKRSLINAYRHKDCDNVTIHVGNFSDIEPDLPDDYDYVCLIGVFEYGQAYIGGETPFHDFYNILKKHVKPDGRIAIAIENKMGLKYWAGCREDHLGSFFSGLEDYPDGGVVRTFTRPGLEKILQECGETQYHFYYPYPDYKFMTMVYSDRYLPKVGELSNNLRNFDRDRMLLFDEKKVFDMLIRDGLFPLYSNSYMVLTGAEPEVAYSRFSNDRAAHLAIRTDIGSHKGRKYVRKFAAKPEAKEHIQALADNYSAFVARFAGSSLQVNCLQEKSTEDGEVYVEFEFLENAVTLEELLDECLQKKDEVGFEKLWNRYLEVLNWKAKGSLQDFDLIFPNICVQGDVWTMIDYEWTTAEMTAEDIAKRALYCYVLENGRRQDNPILKKLLIKMGMDEQAFRRLGEQELLFQKKVMREKDGQMRTAVTDMRHLIGHLALPMKEVFSEFSNRKIQIFEDFGAGYSPEYSYYINNAYVAEGLIRAQIPVVSGIRAIRLDPAENPCLVQVESIAYAGRKLTAEECALAVVTNGILLEPEKKAQSTVFFDTADPNINIRLDSLDLQQEAVLTVELRIVQLADSLYEDLKNKLTTGRKRFWFQK